MINLALLYGGKSAERDVSIAGANEVERALDRNKYMVFKYDAATDLEALVHDAKRLDCVFILLHGRFGEDGTVQGMLDLLGLPYQSAGVLGSSMAMDKHVSKVMYQRAGLQTPAWMCVRRGEEVDAGHIVDRLGLPLIVKPSGQGSSVGIGIVEDHEDLTSMIDEAFRWDSHVIVEEFVKGTEITGGVLGLDDLEALPIVEIVPGEDFAFFDYEAKYKPGATTEICPARLSPELTSLAQDMAIKAHEALRLSIYSRTDMIVSEDGEIYCIETNTIPGMTPTSLFPQAAKVHGLDFPALLDRLIELAIERKGQE
ncbi:MAG: D-alanine--D-alanine ligase [Thermodesulfobacteria bacterium]|nr:D-alanine--D-alanine ligase [Thermodesulfobacteriota bacterium]